MGPTAPTPDKRLTPINLPNVLPQFRVWRSAALTTVAGGFVKIGFDTRTYDAGNNFDLTNGYLVTPRKGNYQINARVGAGGSQNITILSLYINGVEYSRGDDERVANTDQGVTVADVLPLNAGDQVAAYLYCSNAISIENTSPWAYMSGFMLPSYI